MKPMFKAGDHVSAKRWDKTSGPSLRMGECVVVTVAKARSESGYMVAIKNARGEMMSLDANWLEPLLNMPVDETREKATIEMPTL